METPIALQLYSVREALAGDFDKTVRRVAEMGYQGVETAGFPGTTPQAAARLFAELGLSICSAHAPLPLEEKKAEVLEMMAALNCPRLVCPWQPPELFTTRAGIRRVCDLLNQASQVAGEHGFALGYHNHWAEIESRIDGRPAYQVMLEYLEPAIFLELDVYWIQVAGLDPAQVVRALGKRAPLQHIKDGPAVRGQPNTTLGSGVLDIPAVIEAGRGNADWLIVELDACATDIFEAVQQSYNYLISLK